LRWNIGKGTTIEKGNEIKWYTQEKGGAAIFSPGDSNVTTGTPKVMPIRLARAPPSECPINQMLELGLNAKVVKAVRWSREIIH